jgi:hypothetical protein
VPYDLQESGRVVVEVAVNDRGPYPFALDTAASISFIFDEFRRELELDADPDVSATVHGLVASGRFPLVDIDRLKLGSEIWSHVKVVSLPGETEASAGIAGILGLDFLRRYGLGFSTQDRAIRRYSPDRARSSSYRGWASVPLEPVTIGASSEPLYFFDIEIGGRTVPALFDLGAGLNVINPPGARFLCLAPVGGREDSLLSGALESMAILARLDSEEVRTADVGWRREVFLIADVEIFATLMHGDRPLAIIGAGVFIQRDFFIDFRRERLLVRVAMNEVDDAADDHEADESP